MKVLFVSSPGLGHLFPLIPLAWGFRASGHDVVIATAEHAERAAGSGLEVVDVAPHFSSVAAFERVAQDQPDFVTTVATRPAVDLAEWGVQIAAVNRPMIDGLIALTDDFHPDLVVYEQGATAGLFAAARAGVPAVQRNHGAFATGTMHEAIAGFLGDFFTRYELPSRLPEPDVIIESFPPSMVLDRPPEGWFMRWVPYGGGAVHGDRWPTAPDRTRVAVSMGTIELQAFGLGAVESLIEAAAEVDAEFVLALGDLDTGPLEPLPGNIRTVGWTPVHRLLRQCTAVVHHGSGGMIMNSIEAGTPQLLAPDSRDMFQHSGRDAVRKLGTGLVSTADEIGPEMLTELIQNDQFARQMAVVREEMHALPSPAETVRRIVAEV
ncbi:glycosyltransferase [Saccharomonospora iraqiensis]|uniref:glycosyltransferase n=1 Tax=Saccharomonospora iraqiensis TaxID=52698 RepID=UPI00022E6E5D|nr:glycosyltransferase [Saccharomonospora iraqiensis]